MQELRLICLGGVVFSPFVRHLLFSHVISNTSYSYSDAVLVLCLWVVIIATKVYEEQKEGTNVKVKGKGGASGCSDLVSL